MKAFYKIPSLFTLCPVNDVWDVFKMYSYFPHCQKTIGIIDNSYKLFTLPITYTLLKWLYNLLKK